MSPYSDNGVDSLIATLLEANPIALGCAMDIGANNGHGGSNSLALEEQGWTVLCVEPNPLLAESGRACRRLWRQVACGAKDEESREFWAMGGGSYASSSALVLPSGDVPYGGGAPAENLRFKVQVRTADRLLEEAGFHRLDLLTIDVEGYENEVLAGFSIERWRPTYIIVESMKYQMAPPPGYTLQARLQFDNVFVRNPTTSEEV